MNSKRQGIIFPNIPSLKQQQNYQKALVFKGSFIEIMLHIENDLQNCLLIFFGADKEKDIYNILYYDFFSDESVTFKTKRNLLDVAIKIRDLDHSPIKPYFTLLDNLIKLRNIIAHCLCAHDYQEGISFIKPLATKTVWKGVHKTFEIDTKTGDEIFYQVGLVHCGLLIIKDLLELNIKYREYKEPFDRLKDLDKSIDIDLLNSEGVFSLFESEDAKKERLRKIKKAAKGSQFKK